MARPKKSSRERELEQQVNTLRDTLQLAALGNTRTSTPQRSVGDLWVGVRNISDLTLGIKSPFATEPDLQLYADLGEPNPGQVGVISYAWWLQLRKGNHVANGLIQRDDRVLGDSWAPAPEDRPEDLPKNYTANQVLDPVEWIRSRTEDEIRDGIMAMTNPAPLWRLQRVVNEKLREYQAEYSPEDKNGPTKAFQRLSAVYQLVDNLTSQRLTDSLPE